MKSAKMRALEDAMDKLAQVVFSSKKRTPSKSWSLLFVKGLNIKVFDENEFSDDVEQAEAERLEWLAEKQAREREASQNE